MPHCAEPIGQMQESQTTYEAVVRLFERHHHGRLTPSYVAHQFGTSVERAEAVLDEMVRHSLLELDFDDRGQLFYSLASGVPDAQWGAQQRPSERGHPGAAYERGPRGVDGSVGHSKPGYEVEGGKRGGYASSPSRDGRDGSLHGGTSGWRGQQAGHPHAFDGANNSEETRHTRGDAPAKGGRATSGELVRRRPSEMTSSSSADPMIAGLLSVLLPGGGQLYNRQVGKSIALFVTWWFMWSFALGWVVNIWAAIDAYNIAQHRQNDES